MAQYILTTNMPGYLPAGDSINIFEATPDEAIAALLDEAEFQLGEYWDTEDEVVQSDEAYLESLRGSEGRADLAFTLRTYGETGIRLESYANSFGAMVRLSLVSE